MLIKIHPFIWLKFVKLTPFTQEKKIDTVNQLLFTCDKIFARLTRTSSLRLFLATSQSFSYGFCYNMGLNKASSLTLVAAICKQVFQLFIAK